MAIYEKSENLTLLDKLAYLKQHRIIRQRELEEKEFSYRCMPNKKAYYKSEISMLLPRLIIYSLLEVVAIVPTIYAIVKLVQEGRTENMGMALILILFGPFAVTNAFRCYGLWMATLEFVSKLNSIEHEKESLLFRISYLKTDIEEMSKEMTKLQQEIAAIEQEREKELSE